MADIVNVDAAGRNVGGDQHPAIPGGETAEGLLACVLGFVAVKGGGVDADIVQLHR